MSSAKQVGEALLTLARSANGTSSITISLHPKELGNVAVVLQRGSDGSTAITITAGRAETLRHLSANVAQLHAALDAAEVPATNRVLTFSQPAASHPWHISQSSGASDQGAGAPPGQTDLAFGQGQEQREPRGHWTQPANASGPAFTTRESAGSLAAIPRMPGKTTTNAYSINITA